ncbi:hypothetical protein BaRGS_00012572 [Batillaria attramentaria]|uniref:EF-hand domain-containing protein n=1 Tax=Batillaria attramentaria TaxID=370345 RepID=A0ABD0L9V7_9CAEN
MAPRGGKGGADALHNEDISFDLDRLFDHYNMDHIPVDQRLNGFKHRNLPHVKHYKAAVNIFGGPLSRKRVMIAPPMETPLKHRLGMYMNRREHPLPPVLNNQAQPVAPAPKPPTEEELQEKAQKEKEASYKNWFAERQALRGKLDGMGLSEDLLRRKVDKTELEARVERQLRAKRTWKPEPEPEPEPAPEVKTPPVVPNVNAPVPAGLQALDRFLAEKKLRLIDLFTNADRNKDWRLTKQELYRAVKQYKIPLTPSDIEDLMVMLDQDFDEHLDYGEVSRGLAALRVERRAVRRESGSQGGSGSASHALSKISPFSRDMSHKQNGYAGVSSPERDLSRPGYVENEGDQVTAEEVGEDETQAETERRADSVTESVSLSRSGSAAHTRSGSAARSRGGSAARSRSSSSTPNSLEPPPPDLREERRMGSSDEEMVELRKHDKAVLERAKAKKWPMPDKKRDEAPGVIRVGHKGVDNHCRVSTMEGEAGSLMDAFRRTALKEYFQAVRLCQQNDVVLTPELLDRVLLYPPEIPHSELKKKLRIPSGPLSGLNEDFAKPPRKPKTPPEIRHKDRMKRTKSGALLIDSRHMYPTLNKITPVASKENLSTGRALVSRKTDCWMSFEEYHQYTKHLPVRYKQLTTSDPNEMPDLSKFWPGYMLDKLVLCMPLEPHEKTPWSKGSSYIFQSTRQRRPAYPAKYY